MIEIPLRIITIIVFIFTILFSLSMAFTLFLPAIMIYFIQSNGQEEVDWIKFLFSQLGLQVGLFLLVSVSLSFSMWTLPEKWLPDFVNLSMGITLLLTGAISIITSIVVIVLNGFSILYLLGILAGVFCFVWSIKAFQNA